MAEATGNKLEKAGDWPSLAEELSSCCVGERQRKESQDECCFDEDDSRNADRMCSNKFPPPLSILAGKCCCSLFPYCMPRGGLRPIRKNGRLVLQEVKVPRQFMLHPVRKDGRLILLLLLDHDEEDWKRVDSKDLEESKADKMSVDEFHVVEEKNSSSENQVRRELSIAEDKQLEAAGTKIVPALGRDAASVSQCTPRNSEDEGSRSRINDSSADGGRMPEGRPLFPSTRRATGKERAPGPLGTFCGASQWNRNFRFEGVLPWTH